MAAKENDLDNLNSAIDDELDEIKNLVQNQIDNMQTEREASGDTSSWQELVKDAAREQRGETSRYAEQSETVQTADSAETAEITDTAEAAEEQSAETAADTEEPSVPAAPVFTECQLCGRDDVALDSEGYCDECKEKMRHYPFDKWQYLIPVMAVFFVVIAALFNTTSWSTYSGTAKAQGYVRNKQYSSALSQYEEINSAIETAGGSYGFKYLRNQLVIYDKMGVSAFSSMNTFIDTYYTGTSIEKFYNRYARQEQEKIDEYSDTYEYFAVAAKDDTSTTFEALIENFDEQIDGKDLNAAYVNYYKYYASLMFDQEVDVQKKYVDAIAAEGKEYESLYLPLYAEVALNGRDYDSVLQYCNQLEKLNKEDIYPSLYRTVAYRIQGNLVKANKACNDGLDINSSSVALNYQMAIICLLNDNLQLAESYAEVAHEGATTSSSYVSAASLYYLIAEFRVAEYEKDSDTTHAESEQEIADNIATEVDEYGYTLSPDIDEILDGTKTLIEVFQEGSGDLTW